VSDFGSGRPRAGMLGCVAFERMLGAALPRIESHELILKAAEEQWKARI
jgi:hypothetical protein